MLIICAALLLCGCAVLLPASRGGVRLRAVPRAGDVPVPSTASADDPVTRPVRGRWAAPVVAGVGCLVLIGGPLGVAAGVAVTLGVGHVVRRLEPAAVRRRRARLAADLPAAADLLAACLLAGASPVDAARLVADALPGPLAAKLDAVAAAIRLGEQPADAWRRLANEPELAPLARTMARAVASGAPLATALTRLADERRQAMRAHASGAAQRVGVRAAAPLGLCFLPAFVLLGVTPVVASIASTVVLP